jgi:alcohol dehydrogenase class IV
MNYEFSLQTRVVFGLHASEKVTEHIQKSGLSTPLSVLLVTTGDQCIARAVTQITDALLQKGSRKVHIFDSVVPNPDLECVKQCARACKESKPDTVIALGGGSAIDVAKTAAHEAGIRCLVTIPTTAGTGSEISPWAVIRDPELKEKQSMIKKNPDLAILDPHLTLSLPPLHTLACGFDAFSHALESYVSSSANNLTDALAIHALVLIGKNLETVVNDGKNVHARSEMLEGSLLSGIAMLHAGLGLTHAIANTIGGVYHEFCHGLVIARALIETLQYNRSAVPTDKYNKAHSLTKTLLSAAAKKCFSLLDVPDMAIKEQDLPLIVARSMRNVNVFTNPRKPAREDIERIVRRCFCVHR